MYNLKINPNRSVYRFNQFNPNSQQNRSKTNMQGVTFTSTPLLEASTLSSKVINAYEKLSKKSKDILANAENLQETFEHSNCNVKLSTIIDSKKPGNYFLDVSVSPKNQDPKLTPKFSRYLGWGPLQKILNLEDKNILTNIIKTIGDGIISL